MPEPAVEPSIRGYLHVLRSGRWWVAAFSLLGLAIGLTLSLTATKQYSATAQLLVQSAGSIDLTTGGQSAITSAEVQTELQLVNSAQVQSQVLKKLGSIPGVSASQVGQTNVIAVTVGQPEPGARGEDRQRVRQCLRRLVHRDHDQQPGRGGEPA